MHGDLVIWGVRQRAFTRGTARVSPMAMITADTITDTQIQELRSRAQNAALGGNHAMVDLCDEALGWVDHRNEGDVRGARARIAEILNVRGAQ